MHAGLPCFLAASFLCIGGWMAGAKAAEAAPLGAALPGAAPPDRADVAAAIDLSIRYLLDHCGPDGRFAYIRQAEHLGAGRFVDEAKYNLLRHGGAMFSLTQARARANRRGDAALAAEIGRTLARAADYLLLRLDGVPGFPPEALALWSPRDEMEGLDDQAGRRAKLGGSGLGLLALASMEIQSPGSIDRSVLTGLGAFLRGMASPDGSVVSSLDEHGRPEAFVSLYYPGEAAYGLAMLSRLDDNPEWMETAAAILTRLANARRGRPHITDHWAVMATGPVLEWVEEVPQRELLLDHAARIVENILAEQNRASRNPAIAGSFRNDGSLAPASTRMEALAAAFDFLPEAAYAALRRRMQTAMRRGAAFLMPHQIRQGPLIGGFPRAAAALPLPDAPPPGAAEAERLAHRERRSAVRAFNRRIPEVRIDYVQHALSALMGFERMLE